MKIIAVEKGDWYEQVETDIRALLNGGFGKTFLDNENNFKYDTEIHFIRKRRK